MIEDLMPGKTRTPPFYGSWTPGSVAGAGSHPQKCWE